MNPRRATRLPTFAIAAVVLLLGAAALWWWASDSHEAIVLAETSPAAQRASAASATPGGAWALLAEATRQADAGAPQGQRFCGAPFMDESAEPTEAMRARLQRHVDAAAAAAAKRLAQAPDELGRLAAAVLDEDESRIAAMASQTRDPLVYGLAAQMCHTLLMRARLTLRIEAQKNGAPPDVSVEPPPSACSSVTWSKWVDIDPGNRMAWWVLASQVDNRDDAIRAVRRGNAAPRATMLQGQLFKRIAAEYPGADAATLTPLLVRTQRVYDGMGTQSGLGLMTACERSNERDAPRERDSERDRECQQLMLDATERMQSLRSRYAWARSLVETDKVSPDRLSHRPEELKALQQSVEQWVHLGQRPWEGPLTCERSRRQQAFEIAVANEGELNAAIRMSREFPPPAPAR